MAPNEGRNNWCHSRLRDFDFETFRDFFILWDQKTSGAMAPVAPPSSAPLNIDKHYWDDYTWNYDYKSTANNDNNDVMTLLEGFFILNGEPSPCIKKWADVFTQSIIAAY